MKWYQRVFRYPEAWLLTIVALVTRLWQLHLPPAVVFDEVYFRTFAGNYLDGHYFFDIHPPLVKLILAGLANLLHIEPAQLAGGDPAAVILRVVPALAGAALVPLIYIIIRQFGMGRRVATIGALLILLDNALLVESRFILMDSLLLLAGFGALSSYLALRRRRGWVRWLWVIAIAVLLGILVTIKWSGLAVAGLIATIWLVDGVLKHIDWRRLLGEAGTVLLIVTIIYIGSFMIHFSLLTKSGEGDAFMSPKFQSLLQGNTLYNPSARMSFWDKFVELNQEMYTAQSSLKGVEHPYASKWYTWPLEIRPVYYWQGEMIKERQGNIYLLGNPVVWWGSTIAVIGALLVWLIKPRALGKRRQLVAFLLAGYGLNFIPFAFIDRPMFLYHYLFALVFAILLLCALLGLLFDWQQQKYGKRVVAQTFWAIVIVIGLGFLYFLPLSYGWPLSTADLQQRMWLPSWR
jgi:dolichyl-phosphate-mannose-protein mannosyltransferase